MNNNYRLRYAPSPTGFLHIGNTRTALMNYLFAKHYNGTFIVRIEDTDIERNVPGAIESQFKNLKWLGIIPDESIYTSNDKKYGEYIQSKKFDRYMELANKLIEEKKAYRCFCTIEELEKEKQRQIDSGIVATKYNRKCRNLTTEEINDNLKLQKTFSIRFSVPDNEIFATDDIIRGNVQFASEDLGDFVIIKTNNIATYNFAVVVDDYDMQITHVIRGEEHISNTPRQLMIYKAFGWEPPKFCHLTLIVDETKKKLSKRSGNALFFVEQYKNQGYLPEAIFNYISLLGWSPKTEQEVFSKEELIKIFDEKNFSKSPSTFDMNKMKWFNSTYFKKISEEYYLDFIKKFIDKEKFNLDKIDDKWLNEVLLLFKNEIEYGVQINDHINIFFEKLKLDTLTNEILFSISNYKETISNFKNKLNSLEVFDEYNIKNIIKQTGIDSNVKGKELFMPIRIAATLVHHGPELAKTIILLGKEKVLKNIEEVI